jgi:hypothetical protein
LTKTKLDNAQKFCEKLTMMMGDVPAMLQEGLTGWIDFFYHELDDEVTRESDESVVGSLLDASGA